MRIFLTIAWRNIWRNRRRTIIMLFAVAFSIMTTIYFLAMGDGNHDAMLRNSIELMSGYIQIHKTGYQDNPVIEKAFPVTPEILANLENNEQITAFTFRLEVPALIATEINSAGGMVIGIDPERESNVTILNKRIIKGEFLEKTDEKSCVIGEGLAKNLGADTGSKIVILGQSYDGSTGAAKFTVKGILRSSLSELDRSLMLVNLSDNQLLFRADNLVTSIVIMTDRPRETEEIAAYLKKKISGEEYETLSWKELMPEMVQFINIDNYIGYIFQGLILLVVIFGVLSAIFTSVLERTREFGIMLALGTGPAQIVFLVLLETLFVTSLGVGIGFLSGWLLSSYYVDHPIKLPSSSQVATSHFGMADNMLHFSIYPEKIFIAIFFLIIVSLAFSLLPAWRASGLNPDKAIRNITQ